MTKARVCPVPPERDWLVAAAQRKGEKARSSEQSQRSRNSKLTVSGLTSRRSPAARVSRASGFTSSLSCARRSSDYGRLQPARPTAPLHLLGARPRPRYGAASRYSSTPTGRCARRTPSSRTSWHTSTGVSENSPCYLESRAASGPPAPNNHANAPSRGRCTSHGGRKPPDK